MTTDITPAAVGQVLLLEMVTRLLVDAKENMPAGMLPVRLLVANEAFPQSDDFDEPMCRVVFLRHLEPHRRADGDPSVDDVEVTVHLAVPDSMVADNAYSIGRAADTLRAVMNNRTARDSATGTQLRVRNAQSDLNLAPSDNPLIHVAELRFVGDVRKPG